MQEIFEHTIQKQFDNFKIEPSGQTWMEIEKALHPRYEKRRVFWWWVPLTGVIVASLIIWNLYDNESKHPKITPANEQTVKSNPTLPAQKKNIETKKDTIQKILPATVANSNEKRIEKNGYCEVTHEIVIESYRMKKEKIPTQIFIAKNESNKEEKSSNSENQIALNNDMVKKENKTENPITVRNSAMTAKSEEKKSTQKSDSLLFPIKQITTTIKNKSSKKSKWLIVGEAGTLNINSNVFFNLKNSSQYASAPSNIGSGSSSPQAYTTNADEGFSFALGVHHQNQISKHWSFETGLMYRYFQNEQPVGSRKDTSLNYTANLNFTNYYYKTGTTTGITNYAHEITIPLLMNYIINPNQKNKFYLQAGFEAGYIFAKKWLITDEDLNGYYYRSSLLNGFQLNASLGAGVNFNNHIQTNINFRQAVTPLYKINNNKYYTNQISLQVLIPVSFKNKK